MRARIAAGATAALVLAGGMLAEAASATEITGSWTGVIEAHGVQTSPGTPTYKTDTTVQFLGTADVVGNVDNGFQWAADAAWSEVGEIRGSVGGCPYVATINASGTSRAGLVDFTSPSEDDPEWSYLVQHHGLPATWSGQLLPPCLPGPLFPEFGVARVSSGFMPLPNPSVTTLSGSDSQLGLLVSWQLTRAPDSDCDGIPNGQDDSSGSDCGDDGAIDDPGPEGAEAACRRAKRRVERAKERLQEADSAREKKAAKGKLVKAKRKKRRVCL